VEFAYNRAVHSTTQLCPFEVVYGFKPITPLDLLPLPNKERVNMEASKRADFVRKIHETTKQAIEKKGRHVADRVNKKRKEVIFQPGDMVWVHMRKDRFPNLRKSKLMPRGAGPYKVLARINDNAYKIDLPSDEFGVSNSFNVADLTPCYGDDLDASRTMPFQGGEDDEDIPSSTTHSPIEEVAVQDKSNEVRIGPMTRSRTKQLEQQVNSLLLDYDVSDYESFILPKSMYVCILRFVDNTNAIGGDHQDMDGDMKKHGGNKMEHAGIIEDNFTQVLEGGEGGRSTSGET
jgi:hypothetical protein